MLKRREKKKTKKKQNKKGAISKPIYKVNVCNEHLKKNYLDLIEMLKAMGSHFIFYIFKILSK